MQKVITMCDIDGSENDVQVYTILINGKGVALDLCARDAADLMSAVEVYMRVGRRPDSVPIPQAPREKVKRKIAQGTFTCLSCGDRVFPTAQGLAMHVMRAHEGRGGKPANNKPTALVEAFDAVDEVVKYKPHGSAAILPRPLTCPVPDCGRTGYNTVAGLSSHLRQGHNTPESGLVAMQVARDTLALVSAE